MSQETFAYQSSTIFDIKCHSADCCLYLYLYYISVLFGVAAGWNSQRENALNRSALIALPPLLQN